jgi:hypothetical protein
MKQKEEDLLQNNDKKLLGMRTLVRPEPQLCDDESEEEVGRRRRRKESPEKSKEEDLEEDEEFYNQVQHAVQALAVEERTTNKGKSLRPTKTAKIVG